LQRFALRRLGSISLGQARRAGWNGKSPQRSATPTVFRKNECNPEIMMSSTDCRRRRCKRFALRRLGSISLGQARRAGWDGKSPPAQRHANRFSKERMQSGDHDVFHGLQATALQTLRTASTWKHFFGPSAARGVEWKIAPSAAPRQPFFERTNAIRRS